MRAASLNKGRRSRGCGLLAACVAHAYVSTKEACNAQGAQIALDRRCGSTELDHVAENFDEELISKSEE